MKKNEKRNYVIDAIYNIKEVYEEIFEGCSHPDYKVTYLDYNNNVVAERYMSDPFYGSDRIPWEKIRYVEIYMPDEFSRKEVEVGTCERFNLFSHKESYEYSYRCNY